MVMPVVRMIELAVAVYEIGHDELAEGLEDRGNDRNPLQNETIEQELHQKSQERLQDTYDKHMEQQRHSIHQSPLETLVGGEGDRQKDGAVAEQSEKHEDEEVADVLEDLGVGCVLREVLIVHCRDDHDASKHDAREYCDWTCQQTAEQRVETDVATEGEPQIVVIV